MGLGYFSTSVFVVYRLNNNNSRAKIIQTQTQTHESFYTIDLHENRKPIKLHLRHPLNSDSSSTGMAFTFCAV